MAIATGVLFLAFVPSFLAALIVGFLIGLGMSFKQILSDTIVITRSDERFQAEIITIINSVIALSYCFGYAASAKWDAPVYAPALFCIASACMILSLVLGTKLSPSINSKNPNFEVADDNSPTCALS